MKLPARSAPSAGHPAFGRPLRWAAAALLCAGCGGDLLVDLMEKRQPTEPAPPEAADEQAVADHPPVKTLRATATNDRPVDIDIVPGADEPASLTDGYQLQPPEFFRIFHYRDGETFRFAFKHYHWETHAKDAWMFATFLGGLDYHPSRRPKLETGSTLERHIQEAVRRMHPDQEVELQEKKLVELAGRSAWQVEVAGALADRPWDGYLYLFYDDTYLIVLGTGVARGDRRKLYTCRQAIEKTWTHAPLNTPAR